MSSITPHYLANFRSPAALARFFLTCAVGVTVDLWAKVMAVQHLAPRSADPLRFIPGWLEFTYTANEGAVFGLGQGYRWLFVGVSVVAIVFLTWLFAASGRQRFYQFLLGLLLAGVLGNMYDRIMFGHVRDMIHALPAFSWPGTWTLPLIDYPSTFSNRAVFPYIFNVADAMLCVGVFLMIVYSWLHTPRPAAEQEEPAPKAAA